MSTKVISHAASSLVRWLLGLEPRFGRRHYIDTLRPELRECLLRSLAAVREAAVEHRCPFCGREFRSVRGLAMHLARSRRCWLRLVEALRLCAEQVYSR